MELKRYGNIIAIQTDSGSIVGFHSHNLQVARLDDLVWRAFESPETLPKETRSEIQTEIATWNQENDLTAADAHIPQAVRSLTINIAQICNLKCTYCAAGGDGTYGDPMKSVDLTKIYDQLRMLLHDVPNGGSFVITFLGGEPLLVPDAIRAISRFARLQVAGRNIRIRFDIVTNGTLVTPDVAELLASLQCHVTVSLDGPPDINDRNRVTRGGRGSSEKVLKGLENLKAVRSRLGSLNAGAIFGQHNTDVLTTYKYLRELGFDYLKFDFAVENADQNASRAYTESLLKTADFAYQSGGEEELRRINLFDKPFQSLDAKTRIHNHCGAGKSHLQVDTRGRFYVCQWFVNDASEEVGSDLTLDHDKLKAYAEPLTELNGCQTCWARHLCGGGCMYVHKTKNGSKHKKDNEFCFRTRSIIAKGIEYYAEARYQKSEGVRREVH